MIKKLNFCQKYKMLKRKISPLFFGGDFALRIVKSAKVFYNYPERWYPYEEKA